MPKTRSLSPRARACVYKCLVLIKYFGGILHALWRFTHQHVRLYYLLKVRLLQSPNYSVIITPEKTVRDSLGLLNIQFMLAFLQFPPIFSCSFRSRILPRSSIALASLASRVIGWYPIPGVPIPQAADWYRPVAR